MYVAAIVTLAPILSPKDLYLWPELQDLLLFLSCLLLCVSVSVIVEEIFAVAVLLKIFTHISWKSSKCRGALSHGLLL